MVASIQHGRVACSFCIHGHTPSAAWSYQALGGPVHQPFDCYFRWNCGRRSDGAGGTSVQPNNFSEGTGRMIPSMN